MLFLSRVYIISNCRPKNKMTIYGCGSCATHSGIIINYCRYIRVMISLMCYFISNFICSESRYIILNNVYRTYNLSIIMLCISISLMGKGICGDSCAGVVL